MHFYCLLQPKSSEKSMRFRKLSGISDEMGTAVICQAMVFGNFNTLSGTGVAFSRNPGTIDICGTDSSLIEY